MKVAFYTLGCKVNQYETQGIREDFLRAGFDEVADNELADVYVVNTCTVTNLADRKSRQALRRMKRLNPKSIIAVTGCYAQMKPEEIGGIAGVQLVFGTNEKDQILKEVLRQLNNPSRETVYRRLPYKDIIEYEETGSIVSMESRTRAYVKVQEGCDRFCSYCIIPYARGIIRSRSPLSIKREVEALVGKGFSEIILTGINTALYGREENFRGKYLEDLCVVGIEASYLGILPLIEMLENISGKFRIRLSSLEPNVVDSVYVEQLIKCQGLCHHLHLSLQSGSDVILTAMNRRYSRRDYLNILEVLKATDLNYGITTDIIVGFPGETEADFQDTLRLVEAEDFCKVHIFPYSKREGTKAYEMANQVESIVIKDRVGRLTKAADESHLRFLRKNIGSYRQVLIEEYDSKAKAYVGYSDNYIRVFVTSEKDLSHEMVTPLLTQTFRNGLIGVL